MNAPLRHGLIDCEVFYFRGPEDDVLIGFLDRGYEFMGRSRILGA